MVKKIIKILLCGVIVYPICYICIQLEGPKSDDNWLVTLVIDVIVASILIINTIWEEYKKNKKK